jgi:hypothetical protein
LLALPAGVALPVPPVAVSDVLGMPGVLDAWDGSGWILLAVLPAPMLRSSMLIRSLALSRSCRRRLISLLTSTAIAPAVVPVPAVVVLSAAPGAAVTPGDGARLLLDATSGEDALLVADVPATALGLLSEVAAAVPDPVSDAVLPVAGVAVLPALASPDMTALLPPLAGDGSGVAAL